MGENTRAGGEIGRRTALKAMAGAISVSGTAGRVAAQETTQGGTTQGGIDYGGWFSDVSNYSGTVDKRGQSQVTVRVGAQGNGGNFAFDPPAVRVDPGTKVVWRWTGKGGQHTVTALTAGFGSDLVGEKGHTFTQTLDAQGIYKYYCQPHRPLGMKGAVVAGNPAARSRGPSGPFGLSITSTGLAVAIAVGMAVLSPLAFLLVLVRNRDRLY